VRTLAVQSTCHVLTEDPDLAAVIPAERRAEAEELCLAPLMRVPSGRWAPPEDPGPDSLGILVLDGLLIRKITVGERDAVGILGPGDLIRPWPPSDDPALKAQWRAVGPARLAMLDRGFTQHLGSYPELGGAIVERLAQRTREIAVNLAIASHTRVDERLLLLMWLMAGRFGRIRADGVLLPVKLTHSLLGDLVAARRPTVTTALASLADQGLVIHGPDGWLLKGPAPVSVLELG
jgi:CRP-like cAMP-binding protein